MTAQTRRIALALAGVSLLVALVQVISFSGVGGSTWPSLPRVVDYLTDPDNRSVTESALLTTTFAAAKGLATGTLCALAVAVGAILVPALRPGVDQLAAVVHAVPMVAIAPLLIATAGAGSAPTILATLAAGFAVFVAATTGLAATSTVHREVFSALGGGRVATLIRLQLPSAVPSILDGLTIAAPAAMLGAIFGEWFGAPTGIGVLLVSQMQNFQMDALWATSFCAAALSLLAYGLLSTLRKTAIRRMA